MIRNPIYCGRIFIQASERGMSNAKVIVQVRGATMQITINNEKILEEKNIIPPGVFFSTKNFLGGEDLLFRETNCGYNRVFTASAYSPAAR
jgi:hypothetical protein